MEGSMESPFKDEELATILRSMMVPGATISKEKSELAVEKLNAITNFSIYFEGLSKPQAQLKYIYREMPTGSKGADVDDEDGESVFDAIGELFDRVGACPVLVARDAEGKEVERLFEDYFKGIDVSNFVKTVSGKFNEAFGPIIAEIEAMKEAKDRK